ncbi:zinc finger, CCHC-type containing protein [Tanacetum coccineum]
MTETHLKNLSQLVYLDLSHNSLVIELGSDWSPSFSLEVMSLSSCKLGPSFPSWLQTQKNLSIIDVSDVFLMIRHMIVALSSCESEFMAATGAACQALWLKRLLSELTGWEEKRITLKVDNVSAIALVRNPVFHGRSKHIDIRYHFIRECVENGHINVEHVRGELQRADILTKALPRLKFVTMRQMLGVQDLGRSNDQD